MGCGTSRLSDGQPANRARPSANSTTQQTSSRGGALTTGGTSSNNAFSNNPASSSNNINGRPNKPLRPVSPVPRCPPERALHPWTPSRLQAEREAFFETRVTGDPAVWTALRHVCDSLRAGDVAAAQSVMDAVGLTCPTGRIKSERSRGSISGTNTAASRAEERERRKGAIFDGTGRGYEIPGWVVSDPLDLAPEPAATVGVESEKLSGADSDEDEDYDYDDEDDDDDEIASTKLAKRRRRRSEREKGKSREEDIGATVRIRARLSDRGSDVLVDIGERQKVRVLVRRILEQSGDSSRGSGAGTGTGKRLRLFVLGKELGEDKTVAESGWVEGQIVSAMVFGGDQA